MKNLSNNSITFISNKSNDIFNRQYSFLECAYLIKIKWQQKSFMNYTIIKENHKPRNKRIGLKIITSTRQSCWVKRLIHRVPGMDLVLTTLYFPFGFQTSIETGLAILESGQTSNSQTNKSRVCDEVLQVVWGGSLLRVKSVEALPHHVVLVIFNWSWQVDSVDQVMWDGKEVIYCGACLFVAILHEYIWSFHFAIDKKATQAEDTYTLWIEIWENT